MNKNRRGFTLIELSIVLVIIGLVIGGIIVSQSILSTSKVTSVVAQIQQFDEGVSSFKSRYNDLPGDSPIFGGDGDGVIDITAGSGFDDCNNSFACELPNFWNSLDPQNYVSSTCASIGVKAYTSGTSRNVPMSKLGTAGSFFIADSLSPANSGSTAFNADKTKKLNYYAILGPSQIQTLSVNSWYQLSATTATNSAVRPVDLLALDQKIDDGLPASGNVLSGDVANGGDGTGGLFTSPLAACSGATYNTSNTGYTCTPLILIGSQAAK